MATLAAYLNSLTYVIDEANKLIPRHQQWKLKTGTYCCFNAFSRVDVRIEVKIPGSVEGYIVDLRGGRFVILLIKLTLDIQLPILRYGKRLTCRVSCELY